VVIEEIKVDKCSLFWGFRCCPAEWTGRRWVEKLRDPAGDAAWKGEFARRYSFSISTPYSLIFTQDVPQTRARIIKTERRLYFLQLLLHILIWMYLNIKIYLNISILEHVIALKGVYINTNNVDDWGVHQTKLSTSLKSRYILSARTEGWYKNTLTWWWGWNSINVLDEELRIRKKERRMNSKVKIQINKTKFDVNWDKTWLQAQSRCVLGRLLLAPIYRWSGLEDSVGFDTN
jgi:hypothetical protein